MAQEKQQTKEKKEKKYVNNVMAWCLIAVEIIAALLIGFLVMR